MKPLTTNLYDSITFYANFVKENAAIKEVNSQIFGAPYVM